MSTSTIYYYPPCKLIRPISFGVNMIAMDYDELGNINKSKMFNTNGGSNTGHHGKMVWNDK